MVLVNKIYNIYEMSYVDVQGWLKETDLVMAPIASTERHGAHLPLGIDSMMTLAVTERAAKMADVPYTPLEPFGYSPHHMVTPGWGAGTITLRSETTRNLVNDIARSLIFHGFNKIVFVCYHGSMLQVIEPIIRTLRYQMGALVVWYKPFSERDIFSGGSLKGVISGEETTGGGWHSGEQETSFSLFLHPELTRIDRAVKESAHAPKWLGPDFTKKDGTRTVAFKGAEVATIPMDHYEYSNSATLGDPFKGSAEKGQKMCEVTAQHLADFLIALKKVKVEVKNRDWPERAL